MDNDWLRTKRDDDGSMELWVRGWRLEHRFVPVLPLVLALGFPFASAPPPFRIRSSSSGRRTIPRHTPASFAAFCGKRIRRWRSIR